MDRLSFIKENPLNQTESKCGQTLCECDDVNNSNWIRSMKKTNRFQLVGMAITAFLCAVAFAKYKSDATKINIDEWLRQKNETAIGCSSGGQNNSNASWPEDITAGWNYWVRLYRPRPEILNGKWKFPEVQPLS